MCGGGAFLFKCEYDDRLKQTNKKVKFWSELFRDVLPCVKNMKKQNKAKTKTKQNKTKLTNKQTKNNQERDTF